MKSTTPQKAVVGKVPKKDSTEYSASESEAVQSTGHHRVVQSKNAPEEH